MKQTYLYLTKNKYLNFDVQIKNQLLILCLDTLNKKFSVKFNLFHYKGFILTKNNYLYFINKKPAKKILSRLLDLIKNFVRGFCLILEIIGLGFSVTINKNVLRFNIGYNHSIFYIISTKNIKICSKRKLLFLYSYSFIELKKIIIDIKNFRKLNPYKLKGIKEKNELYNKKN
jgi:ribosomal protein L6P/L9E